MKIKCYFAITFFTAVMKICNNFVKNARFCVLVSREITKNITVSFDMKYVQAKTF